MERFRIENGLPELARPNLIVGEGIADVSFLDALLSHFGIRDRCHLGYPDGERKGRDGFSEYFLGLGVKLERAASRVQRILVLIDSDDDPGAAFEHVRQHIGEANDALAEPRRYGVPIVIRQFSDERTPSIGVATLPFDEPGCLETLLLRAADDGTHPLHKCFEAYWRCIAVEDKRVNVRSKKKLTTIIAASNDKNPSCTLGAIWSKEQRAGNPMRIEHPAFRGLVDFLVQSALPDVRR